MQNTILGCGEGKKIVSASYVYCLLHPICGDPFYVGCSIHPEYRLNEHKTHIRQNTGEFEFCNEMHTIYIKKRLLPEIEILEKLRRFSTRKKEREWVKKLCDSGYNLYNRYYNTNYVKINRKMLLVKSN